jgi:hypothetical protein
VLHQVGVSFDLYYDARKHKIKTKLVLSLISKAKFHAYKNNKQNSVSVYFKWTRIAQSVYQLATGWMAGVSTSGNGETLRTRPDRPWCQPNLLRNGYQVIPGSEGAGAWRYPPYPM